MSSDWIKHELPVTRTARYFMSGPVTAHTRQVWIVLHGYAQHAGFFLQKFEPLFGPDKVFVAPEGLSRFYVKGSSGRVGASWMTSEDREDEIRDYIAYLDQLMEALDLPAGVEVGVLGFSQGVATVSRWLGMGRTRVRHVILYAGVFPPDLDPGFDSQRWKGLRIDVLIGNQDPFYKVRDLTSTYQALLEVNSQVKIHEFEGGHEIFPEVLRNMLD